MFYPSVNAYPVRRIHFDAIPRDMNIGFVSIFLRFFERLDQCIQSGLCHLTAQFRFAHYCYSLTVDLCDDHRSRSGGMQEATFPLYSLR